MPAGTGEQCAPRIPGPCSRALRGDDVVDCAHFVHALCVVFLGEEEDFAGELLTHLACEQRRTVACVEGADGCVGLLELAVLFGGDGQVSNYVQGVAAACSPAGDEGDNDLGHGADEALHFQDVQSACACRVDAFCGVAAGVVVAVAAADALVAAGAECPAAVLGGGAVAGEQYGAYVGGHAGVVEGTVEFVHGVRAECVADLGAVECDAYGGQIA